VAALFYGVKAAVVALVLHAAWRLGNRTLRRPALVAIAAAAFVALFFFEAPFPAIIVAAALVGWWLRAQLSNDPAASSHSSTHGAAAPAASAASDALPAVIDDDSATPSHARWHPASFVRTLCIGIGLWLIAMLALVSSVGWTHTLTQMGWFFSKAAMVTFGGAYAVLPYVYEAAVEHYQWLTAAQMIDGLALGETTPGPLIMIVAFVAYIGGVGNEIVAGSSLASGALAACVVTFFTFLPSFIFILAGGPFIESTRDDLRLAAPLTAITAAVVGVIINLALILAWHVWWPNASTSTPFSNLASGFEWPAALLTVAASIALMRYQVGVIWVIAMCGAAGVAIKLWA
jgi:chromate transporter